MLTTATSSWYSTGLTFTRYLYLTTVCGVCLIHEGLYDCLVLSSKLPTALRLSQHRAPCFGGLLSPQVVTPNSDIDATIMLTNSKPHDSTLAGDCLRKVGELMKEHKMNVQSIDGKHPILKVQKHGDEEPFDVDISFGGDDCIHKSHMVQSTYSCPLF